MRLKLTEQQLHNLYRQFDLMEQSEVSGTTTSGQTSNPTTNTGNDEMEKNSPNLSKFLKLIHLPQLQVLLVVNQMMVVVIRVEGLLNLHLTYLQELI
jgi:hypothetical protein